MRAIIEYDLEGNLIREYKRLTAAARITGTSAPTIWKCCNGRLYTLKKRIFLYAGDSIKQRLNLINEQRYNRSMKHKQLVVINYEDSTVNFHKVDPDVKIDDKYLERCFGYKQSQCSWMISDRIDIRYHDYFNINLK